MKQRLNIDNPFFDLMGRLGDMMLINILFLLYSIPIVTIGASLSAMYQCFYKIQKGRSISVFRDFHQAFCTLSKQAIPPGLAMLGSGLLLVFNLTFLVRVGPRGIWGFVGIGTGCLLLLWEMVFAYLFPILVHKKCPFTEKIVKSLYLSVRNLPYTLPMVLMDLILPVCIALGDFFTGLVLPLYMVVGFGLIAFIDVVLLGHCKDIEYILKG